MKNINIIKDMLVDYRNSIVGNLSNEEIKYIDNYIDETIKKIKPIFSFIENIGNDDKKLFEMKQSLEEIIEEDKWLEKLLRTS